MGDKTELVVKSAIYTTYRSVGRVDCRHREQSVAETGGDCKICCTLDLPVDRSGVGNLSRLGLLIPPIALALCRVSWRARTSRAVGLVGDQSVGLDFQRQRLVNLRAT